MSGTEPAAIKEGTSTFCSPPGDTGFFSPPSLLVVATGFFSPPSLLVVAIADGESPAISDL
jgi:hypothetical protein